ncbi:kinase-like domain-containing protein [Russula compacta]|nr:kinase-like domain-containing protein [Russula compacta]
MDIANWKWENLWQGAVGHPLKEGLANTIFFCKLVLQILVDGMTTAQLHIQVEKNDPAVYLERSFSLNTSVGRVEFARQFHNLLYMQRGDGEEEGKDTRTKIQQLKDKISDYRKRFTIESLYTKNTQETKKKRSFTEDSVRASADAGVADWTELKARGYEVELEVIVGARGAVWKLPVKMPPHILTVYRPSDLSEKLIAKNVRKRWSELEILRLLNAAQPKSDTLSHCSISSNNPLYGKVDQVCWGLIEGLAHVHKLCIAHRDIKPDNLLLDRDFSLKIIDFDIAIQVKDEDEEVVGQCRMEVWMTPEVEKSSM